MIADGRRGSILRLLSTAAYFGEAAGAAYTAPKRRSFYSRDDYLKGIPLGRFPHAADIAHVAVFLASDEASFLTGIDIPVDGGSRFKYPTWRPGEYDGSNIKDYAKSIRLTRYGEEAGKLIES